MTEVPSIRDLAKEARDYFYYTGKDHPTLRDEVWLKKSDAPEWINDMCREAHDYGSGLMTPDDWRYLFIVEALDMMIDAASSDDELPDLSYDMEPSVYSSELYDWLSSHGLRASYVDEARENCGSAGSLTEDLQRGMYDEMREVYNAVYEFLTQRQEDLEAELEEADEWHRERFGLDET